MIKLLAIDMDGTLLNSFSKLSKVNLSALYRAKEAGIEIVPTTGEDAFLLAAYAARTFGFVSVCDHEQWGFFV